MKALIAPSLLSADFVNLEREIRILEDAGAEVLHLDVMDGHYVPNLTFGPPVIRAIRRSTQLLLDVHLMIDNAEERLWDYIGEEGKRIDYLTVHYEAVTHLDRLLEEVWEAGVKPGVALNPHTPVQLLENVLHRCHHVLIMSVNPGFGGQSFIEEACRKISTLRSMVESQGREVIIEVDGGVDLGNVSRIVQAGARMLVSGSSIFNSDRPEEHFQALQELARKAGATT